MQGMKDEGDEEYEGKGHVIQNANSQCIKRGRFVKPGGNKTMRYR